MAILSALKAMADRVIASEGQQVAVYFVTKNDEDYDPTVGDTTPTITSVASNAIFLDLGLISNGMMTKAGTLVEMEDKECYLSHAAGFPRTPSPTGDYIVDANGDKWRIAVVKQNNPSGSLEIMYKLLCKK